MPISLNLPAKQQNEHRFKNSVCNETENAGFYIFLLYLCLHFYVSQVVLHFL